MDFSFNNIKNIICFAKSSDHALNLSELKTRYEFEPDGTNQYFGINETNADFFNYSKKALSGDKRRFLDTFLKFLYASDSTQKYLILGMEPTGERAYDFVKKNLAMVEQLAKDLNEYQQKAIANNKKLEIVIRYASEMNDANPSNIYARNPKAYIESLIEIRNLFRQNASLVQFSFSPAIRADLRPEKRLTIPRIEAYWPGKEHIDVIGGTWYIGNSQDADDSNVFYQNYVNWGKQWGRPFGIDELGGRDVMDGNLPDSGDRLLDMLQHIEQMGLDYEYVTLFMESKWGNVALTPLMDTYLQQTAV